MYLSPEEIASLVRDEKEAEALIANLLERFGGVAADGRLTEEARAAKQSSRELARRTASNLLTSFVTRRTHLV